MTKSEKLIKEFIYDHLDEFADIIKEVVKEHDEVSMPVKGDIFTIRGQEYIVESTVSDGYITANRVENRIVRR